VAPAPGAALAGLPAPVARMLDEVLTAAQEALGEDLHAAVLFGSAADGQLRATSDVNLILVLERFSPARVEALRGPLALAQAAVRLSTMFLRRDEVEGAAGAFAQKFADIKRRHRVLLGPDPFADLVIPRPRLVARLDQVLLNLTLRMRALYVARGDREEQLAYLVADLTGPLRTSAQSLLELEGRPAASPKEALRTVAGTLPGDWAPVLARLSEAREQRTLPPGVAGPTLCRLIELAEAMRGRVRALPAA
jgi:hypothetical protein